MILSSDQYNHIEELFDNVKYEYEFKEYLDNSKREDGFYEAMYQLKCYIYNLLSKLTD